MAVSGLLPNHLAVARMSDARGGENPLTQNGKGLICRRFYKLKLCLGKHHQHSESLLTGKQVSAHTLSVLNTCSSPGAPRTQPGLRLSQNRARLENAGSRRPWVRLLQGPVFTCSHSMTLHPTRDDSGLSCGELVTRNSPQEAFSWERGCVCRWGGRKEEKEEGPGKYRVRKRGLYALMRT